MAKHPKDPYSKNRHLIYVASDVWALFERVNQEKRRKNHSPWFQKKILAEIKVNLPLLVKAGVKVPESLFAK